MTACVRRDATFAKREGLTEAIWPDVDAGLPIHVWSSVSRADVAAFLIDEAETPHHVRAYPRITG